MAKYKVPKLVINKITKHENYFEAVIQIRDPTDELINLINNQLKKNPDVFISNVFAQKDGFDIYISSQRFARNLGNKMKRAFRDSELKMTRSIYSRNRQTSKDIYRVTVMFRITKISSIESKLQKT